MDINEPLRTDADFQISFNALYQLAKHMGVDVTVDTNRSFIEFMAEQTAEAHAQQRHLYKCLHPK